MSWYDEVKPPKVWYNTKCVHDYYTIKPQPHTEVDGMYTCTNIRIHVHDVYAPTPHNSTTVVARRRLSHRLYI